jgi:hypothetical protein
MKYSVDYLQDKNIVIIKMKERLTFQIAEQYSKEAIKIAHQNNCTKFLFDHTETILQDGINKIHVDGEELQQFGFKNTDRIAVVVANLKLNSNLTIPESQNSRWSTLKYFNADNIQEALNWL